jgi:hypothetical protein
MNDLAPNDTDEWALARYLAGESLGIDEDAALANRLRSDLVFAEWARRIVRVEQALRLKAVNADADTTAEAVLADWSRGRKELAGKLADVQRATTGQRAVRKCVIFVLFASILALCTLFTLWPTAEKNDPVVARVVGIAYLERDGQRWPLVAGEALKPRDVVRTEAEGTVLIEWGNSDAISRLELHSETVVGFHHGTAGQRIDLERGEFRAEVAKQRPGKPMMLHTPHGHAEVLGTTFVLKVQPESTRLHVEHGRVLIAKDSVGQIVEAHQTGVLNQSGSLDVAYKPVAESLKDGLFAHWPLDEVNNGVTPDLTGRFPGTIRQAKVVAGRAGQAIQFTDRLGIIQTPAVALPPEFTLSMWVKADVWDGHLRFLFANSLQKNETPGIRFFVNRIDVRSDQDKTMHNNRTLHLETGNGEMWARTSSTPAVMKLATWQHIALTVDRPNGNAEMFVDGERVSETSGIRDDFKTHSPLTFGAIPDRWQNAIPGCMDDIRIYSRLLRPAEVRALSTQP